MVVLVVMMSPEALVDADAVDVRVCGGGSGGNGGGVVVDVVVDN